ncbi:Protein Wnt-2b-A [Clonorchis sinensis]|uniref:Protein Wnt n=1 Tax=Clonorchis sinensis TaxID=79923 RepID=A0A8T1MU44_CLOSI|nr:Protein Wnt-2b-A [Clonorchis sinensis]
MKFLRSACDLTQFRLPLFVVRCQFSTMLMVSLILGLSVFETNRLGLGTVKAGSWFFDLLSLTQPSEPKNGGRSPLEITNNFVGHHSPGVEFSVSRYQQQTPFYAAKKSVRATSDSSSPLGRSKYSYGSYNIQTHRSSDKSITQTIQQEGGQVDSNSAPVPLMDRNDLIAQEIAICHALTGLTTQQRKMCLQHSGLVWAMIEGTQLGLHECVHQFRHEQWNCSAVNLLYQLQSETNPVPKVNGLEGVLQRGSRETAFLSASWSAGIVQAVTRACSRGQMGTCDCDPRRREGQDRDSEGVFTWGGCSDPIKFGMRLTRMFLDANDREHREAAILREEQLHGPRFGRERMFDNRGHLRSTEHRLRYVRSFGNSTPSQLSNSTKEPLDLPAKLSPQELQEETLRIMHTKARTLMNLHNRRAGRKLVWKNRIKKCKCHGVSGACSMRTCWQRVNEFRRVGMLLKLAYDKAIRATYEPRLDILRPTKIMERFETRPYSRYTSRGVISNLPIHRSVPPNWVTPTANEAGATRQNPPISSLWERRRFPRGAPEMSQVSKTKLVYLEESPNYCRHDSSIGHLGIAGRLCNASSIDAPNSCSRLCCDRGYETVQYETERNCNCKFFWCCAVHCSICREVVVEHRCRF